MPAYSAASWRAPICFISIRTFEGVGQHFDKLAEVDALVGYVVEYGLCCRRPDTPHRRFSCSASGLRRFGGRVSWCPPRGRLPLRISLCRRALPFRNTRLISAFFPCCATAPIAFHAHLTSSPVKCTIPDVVAGDALPQPPYRRFQAAGGGCCGSSLAGVLNCTSTMSQSAHPPECPRAS